MDHGGEAARPVTVESTENAVAAAAAVAARRGGEARTGTVGEVRIGTGTFGAGQLGVAVVRRDIFVDSDPGAAYHRDFAGRREAPVAAFHGEPGPGVVVVYASIGQLWRGDEAPVALLLVMVHDGAGDYAYAPQHRPGAGRGDGEVLLLPDGVAVVLDNVLGYYALHGEVLVGLLHGGAEGTARVFAGQPRAEDIAGALRYSGLVPVRDSRGARGEYPRRRLLPLVGLGASSAAVAALAAGPGSPAAGFGIFALLLGGLFLVILHVLRA